MPHEEKRALIAMSGGVDSSVAAFLTAQEGYACTGVTMRLFRNPDIGRSALHPCCTQRDTDDAAEVCFRLGIPFEIADYTEQFRASVMCRFAQVYLRGETPNPCIDCNRCMKFDLLLRFARSRGFSRLVTGHYARIERDASGRLLLKKALDESKDQSYVLYMLTQAQLASLSFPLGVLRKEEVRSIARAQGLCNADKHDSQDICFVPDGDYAAFIERFTGAKCRPGQFLDASGAALGTHRGALRYTVGQRRGLGIAAGTRLYVIGKSMEDNTVTLGPEEALLMRALRADDLNWIAFDALRAPLRCTVKIRYRQIEQPATLYPEGEDRVRVEFDAPQRAVAPGQAAVFYDGDTVLGGGRIRSAGEGRCAP